MTPHPSPPARHRRPALVLTLALTALCAPAAIPTLARADDDVSIPHDIESAVDRGLHWLATAQQPDGSFSGMIGGGGNAAATGLSIMAFMARGHVPGQGPYGDNLNRAVDALLSYQTPDGVIAERMQGNATMYDHGIGTVALCEAYGMLDDARQARARTAIARAVRVILTAQRVPKDQDQHGGWRYRIDSFDSDTSVSGWQLMALRGAKNAGAYLPQNAIDDGIAYIKRRASFGGGFNYQHNNGPNAALTGTGILALSLMGQPDTPEVKAGGDFLLRQDARGLFGGGHYYYAVYYCAQAAWQLGGKYWTDLNRSIATDLKSKQNGDGSWSNGEGGDAVCTGMALLALTVPYRYLPIYQR